MLQSGLDPMSNTPRNKVTKQSDWHLLAPTPYVHVFFIRAALLFQRKVFTYDLADRSVTTGTHLPWPLVWVLGLYQKRRIRSSLALPNERPLLSALNAFECKQLWVYTFKDSTTPRPEFIVKCKRQLARLSETPGDLLESLSVLRKRIVHGSKSRQRYIAPNTGRIFTSGIRLLKQPKPIPIANDKGGGYTLVSQGILRTQRA